MDVVTEHLKFMTKYKIYVHHEILGIYHHFIGYQNYTNSLMVPGSLLPQISVVHTYYMLEYGLSSLQTIL